MRLDNDFAADALRCRDVAEENERVGISHTGRRSGAREARLTDPFARWLLSMYSVATQ